MLAWPWAPLVSSELCWLLFDLVYAAYNAAPGHRRWMSVAAESVRILATLLAAAAGFSGGSGAPSSNGKAQRQGFPTSDRPRLKSLLAQCEQLAQPGKPRGGNNRPREYFLFRM